MNDIAYVQQLLDGRRSQLMQDLQELPTTLAGLYPDQDIQQRYEQVFERYRFVSEMRSRPLWEGPAYDSPESQRFEGYQRNLRAEVDNPLRQFLASARDHARQNPHLIDAAGHQRLERAVGVFSVVHAMENDLRDARMEFGRIAVAEARNAFTPANQVDRFVGTGGNSTENAERILDAEDALQESDFHTMYGQAANLARGIGEGKCGNFSAEVVTLAHVHLHNPRREIGDQITVMDFAVAKGRNGEEVEGFNHVAPVIGPPFNPESVVVDAWTREPTVTSVTNYSVAQMRAFDYESTTRADGRDYKQIAAQNHSPQAWLRDNPPRQVTLDTAAATEFRRTMSSHPHADSVFNIQHGYHDRMSNPNAGLALTQQNFDRTAANNFERSASPSPEPTLSAVLQQSRDFFQNRDGRSAPSSSSAPPPGHTPQNRPSSPAPRR
ncbi:hypothetical protein ABT336_01635 [Micromonospora sp. NPDC000207]|uniref:hypothetical protein n=1 Tax=Micromonospora sp. NPDC000207 TaxID=3154246 RepID=UPI0033174617